MDTPGKIKTLFDSLDARRQEQLLDDLRRTLKDGDFERGRQPKACPRCHSPSIIKYGHQSGQQRYRCKGCHRVFNDVTGTYRRGINKRDKFAAFEKLMDGQYLSLRKMEKMIGISHQTAFDWRHKILCSIGAPPPSFEGITELDDVWFLYSQKGRQGLKYSRKRGGSKRRGDNNFQAKLLITADRSSHRDMSLVKIGRITKVDIERKLGGKFKEGATLVSDKHGSIASFARSQKIGHVSFISSKHTAGGEFNVQRVNNLASRIKSIANHKLRGVSTKYLQGYANWFDYNELRTDQEKRDFSRAPSAWDIYANIEGLYERFVKNQSVRTYRCPTRKTFKTAMSPASLSGSYI